MFMFIRGYEILGFWADLSLVEAPFVGGLLVLWSINIPYGPWIMYALFFIALGLIARRVKAYSRGEKPETGWRKSRVTVEEVFAKRKDDTGS